MNTRMIPHRARYLVLGILALLLGFDETSAKANDDAPLPNPALKPLYGGLESLFRKHYPKATSHLLKDTIHFEYDTRIFIVHEATLTGEWQSPMETRGPKPGGILCDIRLEKGEYQGQAVVPQVFDKRYFKIQMLAPYSKTKGVHLIVQLYFPRDVKEDFLKQFTDLVNDFENHLD